jgi:HAD superfamily hydrolase (TIGR01509 family)
MLQCVVFDMDGVILNSEPLYFDLEKRLFRELGFSLDPVEHRKFVGVSNTIMWQTLKDRFALVQDVAWLVDFERNRFDEEIEGEKFPGAIPGVLDLITNLSNENIALAIASSSARATIETVCSVLSIRKHFRQIVSGDDVARGKPWPDIFLYTADLMGVPPANCCVIEDAHSGVIAAKSAGMKCAGFQNDGSGHQDLSGADIVFKNFQELSVQRLLSLSES